jgi:hypothetical protein
VTKTKALLETASDHRAALAQVSPPASIKYGAAITMYDILL